MSPQTALPPSVRRAPRPAPLTAAEEVDRTALVTLVQHLAMLTRLYATRHEWYHATSRLAAEAVGAKLFEATMSPELQASCLAAVCAAPVSPASNAVFMAISRWVQQQRHAAAASWEQRLAALPPRVQAAVWRTPEVQQSAPVMALLARSIARGTRTAGDLALILESWTAISTVIAEIETRWQKAWGAVHVAVPDDTIDDPALLAPWVQYARDVLALPSGTTKRTQQRHLRWRTATVDMLKQWEAASRAVADILDEFVRADLVNGTGPLTTEAIGALPWVQSHEGRVPHTETVLALLPRLPVLPTLAQSMGKAACPRAATVMLDFLKSIFTNRALAPVVGPALWAQYPTPDARVMLLTTGLARRGPWWSQPGFADDVLTALAAVPDEFRPRTEDILYATMGQGSLDTWLQVFITSDLVDATNDYRATELASWLRAIDQVPHWHPSVDGLSACLRHASLPLRQWAFATLARATAPGRADHQTPPSVSAEASPIRPLLPCAR